MAKRWPAGWNERLCSDPGVVAFATKMISIIIITGISIIVITIYLWLYSLIIQSYKAPIKHSISLSSTSRLQWMNSGKTSTLRAIDLDSSDNITEDMLGKFLDRWREIRYLQLPIGCIYMVSVMGLVSPSPIYRVKCPCIAKMMIKTQVFSRFSVDNILVLGGYQPRLACYQNPPTHCWNIFFISLD